GGPPKNEEEAGVLASYDGNQWQIVERKQFTDVTGPGGIEGNRDDDDRLWAMGWDRRSVRLKLLQSGQWHTFLLPKAAHNNDAIHGWYTEWPRIREIGDGKMMMDMHGMFFDFPKSFSVTNTAGIRPIGSHLRYIPDFCQWQGKLVLASDETSIQGNPLAGQPQSNLWFGDLDELRQWGPASGFGGPWVNDQITAGQPSDPFLVNGFDRRVLHLAVRSTMPSTTNELGTRASDQQEIHSLSPELVTLPRVTLHRGDWHRRAPGFSFTVNAPVTVYLAVDARGNPKLNEQWQRTDFHLTWGKDFHDVIYKRDFATGRIEIPANETEHTKGSFGMPHTAFVSAQANHLRIDAGRTVTVTQPNRSDASQNLFPDTVDFKIETDVHGDGNWTHYKTLTVNQFHSHLFDSDFDAQWIRLTANQDCFATAYFHLTANPVTKDAPDLFQGLANVDDGDALGGLVYAAKRNRNLRIVTPNQRYFDFGKETFAFTDDAPEPELAQLLTIKPEFTVDDASVVVQYRGKRLRLPKGNAAFDDGLDNGWPRATREVQSERHLANIHGTFYEIPLLTNGAPPIFTQMRPVSSHSKQIHDFCSWNGLLVLTGMDPQAKRSEHVYIDPAQRVGLWLGGVDDLWKLGKPTGHGGPWQQTNVKAGRASDPYLMTGYDRKCLTLQSDTPTTITIEIDVDHQTGWHRMREFRLEANSPIQFTFPTGFSAHWIRFKSSADCVATAQLLYD
ncbi:MAG: sulfatase, partial [Pirellulaceae bacterium]|nr:sulfatase [Pirellulaceae bacterium]